MNRTRGLCVAVIVVGAMVGSASANMLDNPGFETGDLTSWIPWGDGWRTGSGADAHTGSYAAVDDVANGAGAGYRGMYQDVSVVAGTSYDASVWARQYVWNDIESFFNVKWLDAGNSEISVSESSHLTGYVGDFTQLSMTDLTAPTGAVTARIEAVVWVKETTTSAAWPMFDDFDFETVPEPASLSLLAVGGLALIRRRRK